MTDFDKPTLLLAISSGVFDDDFEEIFGAIKRRRAAIVAARINELSIGDQFRIARITPKAFEGARVELVEFRGANLKVVFLDDIGYVKNRRVYCIGDELIIPRICVGEKI